MRLGLAVPLLDEEALVEEVARGLVLALEGAGVDFALALVDNGSRDGTGAKVDALAAADARILAVHLSPNRGYGGGILAGLRALEARTRPEVLGWCWGDGQVDPAVIPALLQACAGGAMLAKARRVERQDGLERRVVTRGYALALRALGVRTPDVNGCPKLLRREAWEALAPRHEDWFLDAEVVLGCEARGWAIADAPVVMRPRRAGRSKVRLGTVLEFAWNLGAWRVGSREER